MVVGGLHRTVEHKGRGEWSAALDETTSSARQFTVETSLISEEVLSIHDMVSDGNGSLVALASTRDALAGTILRSGDGGRGWSRSKLPTSAGLDDAEYVAVADLMVAGSC